MPTYLADKSYIEGYQPTAADVAVFDALSGAPKDSLNHALRWYKHIASYSKAERSGFPGDKSKNAAAPAANDDDDDVDLFGSDDENDAEAERIKQERLQAYQEKKAKKPALVAKSSIVLDVKPWDDETDMAEMERCVRSIATDGLLWGASKLVPVGYGIKKLQIGCVVEDDKVGTDFLEEEITKFEDLVQSVDVKYLVMTSAATPDSAAASVDIKVVLLGQRYVGKTALMERFLHDRFLSADGYLTTIGAAYGSKRLMLQAPSNRSVVLGVWDTAGGEEYHSLTRIYYRGSRAAVLCYDVTTADSLDRAKFWAGELAKHEPDCRVYLCGCKLDLATEDPAARTVSPAAVKNLGASIFETSSKTGENVAELFAAIAQDFVRGSSGDSAAEASGTVSLSRNANQQQQQQKKQCGC
uniref:EF1_GNE domain-containing protein n=1 Tax=Macrostomum lignano TaxID=282301 RepID=A0A1I8I8W5_9PLAT